MNIAIVGYGKMGKAIEEILIERGHQVVAKLNRKPKAEDLKDVDVAIEFSNPEVAFEIEQKIKAEILGPDAVKQPEEDKKSKKKED